jgi:hypothetical protein
MSLLPLLLLPMVSPWENFKEKTTMHLYLPTVISLPFIAYDALPSSLIDSKVNPRCKQQKSKELGHAP